MNATEARTTVADARQLLIGVYPAGLERSDVIDRLHAVEAALMHPASLCTEGEVFDAVCVGSDQLRDDILEQFTTAALLAYVSARIRKQNNNGEPVALPLGETVRS